MRQFQRCTTAGIQPATALVLILVTTLTRAYHETEDDDAPSFSADTPFPMDGCNCAAFMNGTNRSGNFSVETFANQTFDINTTMNGTCAPRQELSECQQDDADKQASYDDILQDNGVRDEIQERSEALCDKSEIGALRDVMSTEEWRYKTDGREGDRDGSTLYKEIPVGCCNKDTVDFFSRGDDAYQSDYDKEEGREKDKFYPDESGSTNETMRDANVWMTFYCENGANFTRQTNPTTKTYSYPHAGCTAGNYVEAQNLTVQACPAGFACPERLTCRIACTLGNYCPEQNDEPEACEAGFYCEDPTRKTPCPEGHYCREGSSEPTKCLWYVMCNEVELQTPYKNWGLPLATFVFFSIFYLWRLAVWTNWSDFAHLDCWQRKRNRRNAERTRRASTHDSGESTDKNNGHSRSSSIKAKHAKTIKFVTTMKKSKPLNRRISLGASSFFGRSQSEGPSARVLSDVAEGPGVPATSDDECAVPRSGFQSREIGTIKIVGRKRNSVMTMGMSTGNFSAKTRWKLAAGAARAQAAKRTPPSTPTPSPQKKHWKASAGRARLSQSDIPAMIAQLEQEAQDVQSATLNSSDEDLESSEQIISHASSLDLLGGTAEEEPVQPAISAHKPTLTSHPSLIRSQSAPTKVDSAKLTAKQKEEKYFPRSPGSKTSIVDGSEHDEDDDRVNVRAESYLEATSQSPPQKPRRRRASSEAGSPTDGIIFPALSILAEEEEEEGDRIRTVRWQQTRDTDTAIVVDPHVDDNVVELEVPEGCEEIALVNRTKRFDLEFKNLGLKMKGKSGKVVLNGVTGVCEAGHITAIMGPSGAGKSSFMAALTDKAYYGERTGKITCNGKPFTTALCKKEVGYVPQEDTMHRFLTVEEVLIFQAELRLPSHYTEDMRDYRVREVIELLDLGDVLKSQIGDETTRGISGGQRKRVNIGMELVVDPSILFLDEPTSGLDSAGSWTVLHALEQYATIGGLTVITVIHQPRYDIYKLFDKVLFLERGGRTVYLGPAIDAKQYFESELRTKCPDDTNPADFFMDTIFDAGSSGKLSTIWNASQTKIKNDTVYDGRATLVEEEHRNVDIRHSTGKCAQAWACFKRELTLHYHMSHLLEGDALLFTIASATIGAIQFNLGAEELAKIGGSYATSVSCFALVLALQHLRPFGGFRAVVWRDISGGMSPWAFFLASVFANLYLIVLAALLHLSISFAMQALRGSYGQHLLIHIMGGWAISGYAYVVSTAVSPATSQLLITLIVLVLGAVFTGQDPHLNDMGPFSLHVMTTVSPQRWMIEAAMQLEFFEQPPALQIEARKVAEDVGWYFQQFDPETHAPVGNDQIDQKNRCLAILFGLGAISRLVSYMLLKWTHRGEQR